MSKVAAAERFVAKQQQLKQEIAKAIIGQDQVVSGILVGSFYAMSQSYFNWKIIGFALLTTIGLLHQLMQ